MNDKSETTASPAKPEFRGRVYDSIVDTIGATPLVRLVKLAADEGVDADILAKSAFFNPLGSFKDRIGLALSAPAARPAPLGPRAPTLAPTAAHAGARRSRLQVLEATNRKRGGDRPDRCHGGGRVCRQHP